MAELEQWRISAVKKTVDIKELVESSGVELKRRGLQWLGLCPFHKEQTASLSVKVKTRLWHCFGCGAGGDVIEWVKRQEKLGVREAVVWLEEKYGLAGLPKPGPGAKAPSPAPAPVVESAPSSEPALRRLLGRVVSWYGRSLGEDPRGPAYLAGRGVTDKRLLSDFKVGFSNGTLLNALPTEGGVREQLEALGILNAAGRELMYGCVTFPLLDENQDCVGLYGRRVTDEEPKHLYLPGPRRGVFNWQAIKRSGEIVVTESILDALTLIQAGFLETVAAYGVHGITADHWRLLERYQTRTVVLCFDADEAGRAGMEKAAGQLREKGIQAHALALPAGEGGAKQDLNSFFVNRPTASEDFERLLLEANPATRLKNHLRTRHEQKRYEALEGGFLVQYGNRVYEVKGLEKAGARLKATVKASPEAGAEGGPKARFHLDSVDLYSERSRRLYAKACAVLLGQGEDVVLGDVLRVLDLAEAWTPADEVAAAPTLTPEEQDEALAFLKQPDLLEAILRDFETLGYTGEEANKLMAYLAVVSRKLDEPLAVLIQSRSAAGKSSLQDAVLRLVPQEDQVKYTRITGQALYYKSEDSLAHKVLAIEEEGGAKEAGYSIRNLQSSRQLSIAATTKDAATGKLKTEEYRVKGPVALMLTTTEAELDYETSNRFLTLSIDESPAMTERILGKQRENETLAGLLARSRGDGLARKHHNAQRMLRPLKVVNPWAPYLSFPAGSLRARRDHKKYLSLIKAVAFLRQYQRELKTHVLEGGEVLEYIEAGLDDLGTANRLAADILGRSLDELAPASRELLKLVAELAKARGEREGRELKDVRFTRRDIRQHCRWSDFQLKTHLKQLEDLEYLAVLSGAKGKEYVYELHYAPGGEGEKPFLAALTSVEQVKAKLGQGPKQGLGVAESNNLAVLGGDLAERH